MDNLVGYSRKDFNSNISSNLETEIHREDKPTRSIPVFETHDTIKYSVAHCDNVSVVKEIKSQELKGSACNNSDNLRKGSKVTTASKKERTKPDPVVSVNPLQFKHHPNSSFLDRMGQGSVSEPALCNAKDRGDSITLQNMSRENDLLSNKYINDDIVCISKNRGIGGCIYIKSGGKFFKSVIETKPIECEDGVRCHSSGMKNQNCDKNRSVRKKPNNSIMFSTDGLNKSKEDLDDFEIAIFLSGIRNIPKKNLKKQNKAFACKKKKSECRLKQEKKGKGKRKKKENAAASAFGKRFEMVRESYQCPSQLLAVNQYDTRKSSDSKRKQTGKSKYRMNFSTESENEDMFEASDEIKKNRKRQIRILENNESVRSYISIENANENGRRSYRSENKYASSNASKVMSQSSLCQFSDDFKLPKIKIREEDRWAVFENIFRKYASTTRHSGEVIPRKISTEWMSNVGVVDEILTEKEADDAFRQAAGVKITMNAQEYKEFLIMLTLRMKLPYYEIYRRMCGI